jgi:hypothetical protein
MQFAAPFRILSLTVCFSFLLFTGCDSSGPNTQNQPPSVDVTASASTVDVGTQVTLDGSGTSDPDNDNLSFNWSLDAPSGSNASLSDVSAEQPTFTPDVAGDYTATLDVSDGDATRSESTTITAQSSTTELSGTISSDSTLTADQNYVVTGPLTVASGATLSIEPGTHLAFESGTVLGVEANSVLDADGTSSEPITMTATDGNEQPGWWQGVAFYSDSPNNLLNHVEIEYAGSEAPESTRQAGGVVVAGGAAATLTNSTVAQSGAFGVYLDEADAALDGFSANTFSGNADAPVNIFFDHIGVIDSGSSFPSGKTVRVRSGTLEGTQDVTVNDLQDDTPYRFTEEPAFGATISDVGADATVTINAGVEMTFEENIGLNADPGVLTAQGTSGDPITMTATEGNEQPGWWQGVTFHSDDADNLLDHVELRHAGSRAPETIREAAGVAVAGGGSATLTNMTIAQSGAFGVYLDEADATLDGFSSNTFSGNADAPVYIPFSNIGRMDSGSTFADGTTVRVWGTTLAADGATDVTLSPLSGDTPYRFDSTPSVGEDASMTVEPGVEMTFASDVAFHVDSNSWLAAEGTSNEPITMTATEGNGQQGWWRGIGFYSDNANNLLDHVTVRHAGRENLDAILEAANIGVGVGAFLEVTNSTITDGDNHGIYCDPPSSLTVNGNTYQNNAGQDVAGCQ